MDTGNLSETPFPQLLLELYVSAQSGVLKVSKGKIRKAVYIMMGKPIFASSNDPRDRMGALLHRRGIITEEQLDECLKEGTEEGKRVGTVLVERGYLEPEQLVAAVIDQVEEIIFSLFEWTEGAYSLEPGDPVADEVITLDLSAASIILAGVMKRYSIVQIEKVVGPPDRVLRRTSNPAYQFQELQLIPEQENIISSMDETKTVGDLVSLGVETGLMETDVLRLLCGLLLIRTLEPAQEGGKPRATPSPAPAPQTVRETQDDLRSEILRKSREFPRMTFYEKLGVTKRATKGEILTAYNKSAKRLKPEKLPPDYGDVKDAARAVFSQIEEAYAVLFKDEARAKYDQELDKRSASSPGFSEDVEVLEEVAGEDPASARRAFERAKVLFQEKKFDQALKAFKEAIDLDSTVGEYFTGLGLLFATDFPGHEPDMDEAETCFKKAASLDPANGRNYYYLGVIHKSREEWNQAERYFRKVLEINPAHSDARRQIESLAHARG